MRIDKYSMAKGWMMQEDATPEEAKATWDTLETEFEEKRKSWLMASAETDAIIQSINDKFGPGTIFPASDAPIPEMTDTQRIMEWEDRNRKADGGQLVAPSGDGSRPGYQGPEKYVTPLRREGFTGSKFTSVPDPTYSDGRRRVKTKEYKAWLKKEHAKPKPKITQSGIRREPGLLRIAEAFQKADITDDFEYLMRDKESAKAWEKYSGKKQRVYKKGMISTADMAYINQLEKNPADLQFIAESLGEDVDWVLDKLEERSQYVEDVKRERLLGKSDPKYKKPRNDYLKVENWLQKNAKRYANPETFEKALIKRFGTDNQFIKDMKSNKKMIASTYFSDGFKKLMLNSDPRSPVKPHHLKQLISSSLYNYNDKIKAQLTDEIKKIFTSENLPKLRTEARKMIKNNPLFKKFGLDKTITGPFPRVIQAEIGKKLWDDFRAFRHPRATTYEMLKAFEDLVPQEFKGMFKESASAILDAQQNKWPEAKKKLGIADKIAWDHKVPASIIDRGYADIIEYTKVNPVDYEWNSRFKNAKFDTPINRLITKFENATNIGDKKKIVEEMITTKNKFSQNAGGYLDEVSINFNEKTGELKFSSSAKPLNRKMDATEMLKKSQQQIEAWVKDTTGKVKQPMLPSGLAGAYEMMSDDLKAIVNSPKFKKFYASKTGKVLSMAARTPTKLFGLADILIGYLDLTNNKPMMSEAKAWQNMWQAMSFGIYRGGDKQHLAEIKQKFIANGGDGDIFDQVIDLNKSNFKMKNYMENMKKEYQDLTAAGYTNLAKDKMNSAMKNVATMGNANLEKFEKYKTNLDQLQIKDVMKPAKDAQKAGFELLEEEQIKNFPITSSQVHTERGPVANELFNAYWTKDAWKKFLPQNIFLGNFAGPVTDNEKLDAWLKDFQKRDPEGFAEWNLKNRGQDVNNPITLSETAKFMDANKKILGYSVPKAEGGITTLRSKYEYKK